MPLYTGLLFLQLLTLNCRTDVFFFTDHRYSRLTLFFFKKKKLKLKTPFKFLKIIITFERGLTYDIFFFRGNYIEKSNDC